MVKLIRPSIKYRASYLEAFGERSAEPFKGILRVYLQPFPTFKEKQAWIQNNFKKYVDCLYNADKNPPKSIVNQTIYWLVDNQEYLGQIVIRHYLTEKLEQTSGHIGYSIRPSKRRLGYGKLILKLGLKKAKALGFKDILITCNAKNTASKKVILSQPAKLEKLPHQHKDTLRFRINLKN